MLTPFKVSREVFHSIMSFISLSKRDSVRMLEKSYASKNKFFATALHFLTPRAHVTDLYSYDRSKLSLYEEMT